MAHGTLIPLTTRTKDIRPTQSRRVQKPSVVHSFQPIHARIPRCEATSAFAGFDAYPRSGDIYKLAKKRVRFEDGFSLD